MSPTSINKSNLAFSITIRMSWLLTVLHSSITKTSHSKWSLLFDKKLLIVLNSQLAVFTFLCIFSTAGCVLAKYILSLSEKKLEIWLINVDFPVPAAPYIIATDEFSNKRNIASFFSSQSI